MIFKVGKKSKNLAKSFDSSSMDMEELVSMVKVQWNKGIKSPEKVKRL